MENYEKITDKNKKVFRTFVNNLEKYLEYLVAQRRSHNTLAKYRSNINKFIKYVCVHEGESMEQDTFERYKQYLVNSDYKKSSINSYVIIINNYLRYLGMDNLCAKHYKMQDKAYIENIINLSEYKRMLLIAGANENQTSYMIIRTLASTGIRVSELQYLTVESLKNGNGMIEVTSKGKTRQVLLPDETLFELLDYCKNKKLYYGIVFRAKNQEKGLHPSSIWRRIKTIAAKAEIDLAKAYPHNFRHLFAKTYLGEINDIAGLADLLGHSSINTTRIYARKNMSERRESLNRMGL